MRGQITKVPGTSKEPGTSAGLRWAEVFCLVGVALYTLVFFYLQMRLYQGLQMGITDLGYFDQALYNSIHGRWLQTSLYRHGHHILYDRLFLIVLLLVPVYALFPYTPTLFFVQALAVAAGGWALFRLARDRLGSEWAGLGFAAAYLLYPPLQGAVLNQYRFGFRPENLFPPIFLLAFYFLQKERYKAFFALLPLALSIGESEALLCASLGLYLLIFDRKRRRVGAAVLGLSLAWLALSVFVILPHLRAGRPTWYAARAGESGDLLARIPTLVVPFALYAFQLLGPVLFLPLADLSLLVVALPNALLNQAFLLIGYPTQARYDSPHVSTIAPVVFVSAVWGLNRLSLIGRGALAGKWLPAGVVLACALSGLWLGPLKVKYDVDAAKDGAVREIRAAIPKETSLGVDYFTGSRFTQQRELYEFPRNWRRVDYVLLDTTSWWVHKYYARQMEYVGNSPDHRIIYDGQGFRLFKRSEEPPPSMQHQLGANFGNEIELVGYTLSAEKIRPGETLRLILYWQALTRVETHYSVFAHLLDGAGQMRAQEDGVPVDNSWPTTEWEPGEFVVDRYYDLAIGADAPPGEYSVEVGLYYWETGERLSVLDGAGNPRDSRVVIGGVHVVGD